MGTPPRGLRGRLKNHAARSLTGPRAALAGPGVPALVRHRSLVVAVRVLHLHLVLLLAHVIALVRGHLALFAEARGHRLVLLEQEPQRAGLLDRLLDHRL